MPLEDEASIPQQLGCFLLMSPVPDAQALLTLGSVAHAGLSKLQKPRFNTDGQEQGIEKLTSLGAEMAFPCVDRQPICIAAELAPRAIDRAWTTEEQHELFLDSSSLSQHHILPTYRSRDAHSCTCHMFTHVSCVSRVESTD